MKAKKKVGRKSKFNEALCDRILELCKRGKIDTEIAREIGISVATLNNWKGAHPGFLEALKAAKSVPDELVEASLFQRAVGYSHPAVKFFYDKQSGQVICQEYTEHYPPDTVAAIFWLKNRRPKRWRDLQRVQQETYHTGNVSYGVIRDVDGTVETILKQEIKK